MGKKKNLKQIIDYDFTDRDGYEYILYNNFKDLFFNSFNILENGKLLNAQKQEFVKESIFFHGVFGYDRAIDEIARITPAGINDYRFPTQGQFYTANGRTWRRHLSYEPKESGAYAIYALPSRTAFIERVERYVRDIATIDVAILQNVKATANPVIWVTTPDLQLTLEQVLQKKENGESDIVATEEVANALRPQNGGALYLADKFFDLKTRYKNEFLTEIGILTYNEKRERVQVGEVNAGACLAVDSIYTLIDTLNKQFTTYDLPFTAELNEIIEDYFLPESTEKQ